VQHEVAETGKFRREPTILIAPEMAATISGVVCAPIKTQNEEWSDEQFCVVRRSHRDSACNNLDASERFYNRLGFTRSKSYWPPRGEADTYRLLSNSKGGYLHFTDAVEGWLVPRRNPFGLYLYLEDVDALAAEIRQ
jgi:hypothetical protein